MPACLRGTGSAPAVSRTPRLGLPVAGGPICGEVAVRSTLRHRCRPESPCSEPARQNRREITALLARHGFVAYPWEFWHYNDGDAYAELLNRTGRTARYGPVHMDSADGSVTAIDDPLAPLNSTEVIRAAMERVVAAQS